MATNYPIVSGREIVGRVTNVGAAVTEKEEIEAGVDSIRRGARSATDSGAPERVLPVAA